jgi:hypothetical protein
MSLVLGAVGGNIGEVIVTIPFRRIQDLRNWHSAIAFL